MTLRWYLEKIEAGQGAGRWRDLGRWRIEGEIAMQLATVPGELVGLVQQPHLIGCVGQRVRVEKSARLRHAGNVAERRYGDGEAEEVARLHHRPAARMILIWLRQGLEHVTRIDNELRRTVHCLGAGEHILAHDVIHITEQLRIAAVIEKRGQALMAGAPGKDAPPLSQVIDTRPVAAGVDKSDRRLPENRVHQVRVWIGLPRHVYQVKVKTMFLGGRRDEERQRVAGQEGQGLDRVLPAPAQRPVREAEPDVSPGLDDVEETPGSVTEPGGKLALHAECPVA